MKEEETENAPLIDKESFREDIERRVMEMMEEMYRETQDQDKDRDRQHISGQDNSTSPYPPEIMEIMKNVKYTGWVKKKWDLKKFQIALTHSILKLKSIVIPLNQMSQSGEKHAQD